MTEVTYDYQWVLDAKAQREAGPIEDTPKGIAAKPNEEAPTEEQGFLEKMYDRLVAGFTDEEEAIDAMAGKKPSRESLQSSVLDEMEELARRSAEEAALERMEQGITQSLSPYAPRRSLRPPSGTEETTDDPQAIEEATPVTVEELDAEPTGGLMARPVTGDERTALSDMGSEVNIAANYGITDDAGTFSGTELSSAVDKTVRNPIKKALLAGTMEVEVGDNGPVTEGTGYRLARAYEMFNDETVNEALESLPEQEQNRIRQGEASNALGLAIFDRTYDGGSEYRGRGLIQITGLSNYQAVQEILQEQGMDVDLVANPELVNDERYALPAALAFLEYAGMTDEAAESMSTKELNNMINSGANREIAEERWDSVIGALRAAGMDDKADELELRNEYAAQETAGTTVDGAIGPNSRRAMRSWLDQNDVTIPEDATDMDLVVLVNRNS